MMVRMKSVIFNFESDKYTDQFLFDEDPVVIIGQGKVKGQPLGGRNSRIDRFLSIPYAEKPINDLR